jgi:hypothetical protein
MLSSGSYSHSTRATELWAKHKEAGTADEVTRASISSTCKYDELLATMDVPPP